MFRVCLCFFFDRLVCQQCLRDIFAFQNFFKDAWNTFDLITVLGSIVDVLFMEFGVSYVLLTF